MRIPNVFSRELPEEVKQTCRLLGKTPLLQDLSNNELSLLLPHLYTRVYKHKETVFYRGDPAQAIYFVQEGTIEAYLDGVLEREVLAPIAQGDSIGHNAILEKTTRIFNTEVSSHSATLLVLRQDPLVRLMNSHPRVRACIMQQFAKMNNTRLGQFLSAYCESTGIFHIGKIKIL